MLGTGKLSNIFYFKLHFICHIDVLFDCLPIFNFFIRALKPIVNISVIGNV